MFGVPLRHTRLVELKKINPSLKVMLAVGGWDQGSHSFLQVVNSKAVQSKFVASTVEFLRHPDNNFDGLDLDWEYPVNQKEKFTALCKVTRILTSFVNGTGTIYYFFITIYYVRIELTI